MTFRVVFFGIYSIGEASLKALLDAGIHIAAVITKPDDQDKVQPVAALARSRGIEPLQPASVRDAVFLEWLSALGHDLQIVAGFHKVLPQSVVDLPRHGTINVHGSLLPRYRGPNSWKWVLMNGEPETGVTVHRMTPRLDDGDILAQRPLTILPEDTGGSLFERLSLAGAELLAETVQGLARGSVTETPQDESKATYYPAPTHEQCRIDWTRDAETIRNLIRGLAPRPGAWTSLPGGEELRIFTATVVPGVFGEPGTVLERMNGNVVIAAGRGGLEVNASGLRTGQRLGGEELQ